MNKRKIAIFIAATWAVVGMVAGAAFAQTGEQFVLSGLVYVEGGRGLAWLQEPTFTNDKVVIVRVGDSIGPYRLTKILVDQVELEGPGGKLSVPLAGTGGAVSVASIHATQPQQPQGEVVMPAHPHPAYNDPQAIVLERGDPRRNFPASSLLIGAGATLTGKTGPTVAPSPMARAVDRGIVPPESQTPPPVLQPPTYQNPNAIYIPRGDPRRLFPASKLLIGAGAHVQSQP